MAEEEACLGASRRGGQQNDVTARAGWSRGQHVLGGLSGHGYSDGEATCEDREATGPKGGEMLEIGSWFSVRAAGSPALPGRGVDVAQRACKCSGG